MDSMKVNNSQLFEQLTKINKERGQLQNKLILFNFLKISCKLNTSNKPLLLLFLTIHMFKK